MATTNDRPGGPYVGPLPFGREDADLFFGRVREVDDLVSLTFAHRAVLLYAESGAGKSSLINAGLGPRLEQEGLSQLPLARVRGELPEGLHTRNIFVFNALMSWSGPDVDPQTLRDVTIGEYLVMSAARADDGAFAPLRVAIFDQFEELFRLHTERWQDREDFFAQINEALEADSLLRVLFVMREDYIARLDPYVHLLPDRLQTRFRLERLQKSAALKAVTEPLRETHRHFQEGVAEALIEDLLKERIEKDKGAAVEVVGEVVEPVQLQVVCQTLWEALPDDVDEITAEHLEAHGDPVLALGAFYEKSIRRTADKTDVGEGALRRWFGKKLITPSGTRSIVYEGQEDTAGIPNTAVRLLEDDHLIRGERRSGGRWYELNHDRFIEPIKRANVEWLEKRGPAEKIRERLEARVVQWRKGGDLLDEGELAEAERWSDSPEASEVGKSETVLDLIQASRTAIDADVAARKRELKQANALAAEQRQRADEQVRAGKRLKTAFAGVAVLLVVAVIAFVVASIQRGLAEEATASAQQARMEAQVAEAEAAEAGVRLAEAAGNVQEAERLQAQADAARQASEASADEIQDSFVAGQEEVTQLQNALKEAQSEVARLREIETEKNRLGGDLEQAQSEIAGLREIETENQQLTADRQQLQAALNAAREEIDERDAGSQQLDPLGARVAAAEELSNNLNPFIFIPGGTFQMGSPDGVGDANERPQHSQELSSFYIQPYEVTNEEYQLFEPDHTFDEKEGRHPVTGVI